MLRSWELAKMDGFLEPFIEHHGLLRGLIEACIRNRDPEAYQRITKGVLSFSRGWMALHNPETHPSSPAPSSGASPPVPPAYASG